MSWPIVQLSDVAEQCLGKMLDKKKNKGTPMPYLRNPNVRWFDVDTSDLQLMPFEEHELDRFGLKAGDIVICEGGEAGRAAIWDGRLPDLKFQKAIHRVRPGQQLHNRYFVHRLMADYHAGRLSDYYTGTTIKHFTGQDLKRYRFPLPPLSEQKRIAEILDRAESLRRQRRAALALLDELTQSIFLDMFGDPVNNSKKLKRMRLGDVAKVVTGNTPSRKRPEYYGDYIEWIKSDNLNNSMYYATRADESLSELGLSVGRSAPANSILITCIAGSPACIGNSAMVDREVAFNQQINALVDPSVNPHFLYAQTIVGKTLIQQASTNGMKGIVSKGRLEEVLFIVPPDSEQDTFAKRSRAIEQLKETCSKDIRSLDALFDSLQHRAFRGEL